MIQGIGTYIPTMTEFATHWTSANAASGATPITIKGGYTLALFNADKTTLQTALTASLTANQAKKTATGNLLVAKRATAPRIPQFNKAVNALLPGTGYANALSLQPRLSVAESKFLNPHQDMATLWAIINADTTGGTVITLAGGYTLAQFTTDLTALRALYAAYNAAIINARSARKSRDTLLPPAVQRMKQYREIIQAKFAHNDSIYMSLPPLYPSSGTTPAPVENIQWVWNNTLHKAVISFDRSPHGDINRYVLRTSPGPIYKVKYESTVDSINYDDEPRQFVTNVGLTNPNTTALFRIYAVTDEGHEKGSPTITVIRGATSLTLTDSGVTMDKAA